MCDFNLIFVQLTVLILFLSLLLKRDDDEAHEDVHHEERDNDDVDDEKDGDLHAVVVYGTLVLRVRVDGAVQQPGGRETARAGPGSWFKTSSVSYYCVAWANHSISLSIRFLICKV